jgi:hypothetical protein
MGSARDYDQKDMEGEGLTATFLGLLPSVMLEGELEYRLNSTVPCCEPEHRLARSVVRNSTLRPLQGDIRGC